MKDNEIELGVPVTHNEWGVGTISEISKDGTSVKIDFERRPGHNMSREMAIRSLRCLPKDGLEAKWISNATLVAQWYREVPLKLVASALIDIGGNGKLVDFKPSLLKRMPETVKWDTWWKKYQPYIKSSPFFQVNQGHYSLIGTVNEIPDKLPELPPKNRVKATQSDRNQRARVAVNDWTKWLFSIDEVSPPDEPIPQMLIEQLSAIPRDLFLQLSSRLFMGLSQVVLKEQLLTARSQSSWKEAVSKCVLKLQTIQPAKVPSALVLSLTELVCGLNNEAKYKELTNSLNISLSDVVKMDHNLEEEVAGSIAALIIKGNTGAKQTFQNLVVLLPELERKSISKKSLFDVIRLGTIQESVYLLRALDEKDIANILIFLAVLASEKKISSSKLMQVISKEWSPKIKNGNPEFLNAIYVAVLLLGNDSEPFLQQIQEEFRLSLSGDMVAKGLISSLANIAHEEALQVCQRMEQSAKDEIKAINDRLREKESEVEKGQNIIRSLQQHLGKERDDSLFAARRDMLLILGETLQFIYLSNRTREQLIGDVNAGITLAIHAGDAELIGEAGQIVRFSERIHDTKESIASGAEVIVKAPGLKLPVNQNDELVLIKAKVIKKE